MTSRYLLSQPLNDKKVSSPSGNRTPVSRVTGGDTYHYTNEELLGGGVKFGREELTFRNLFIVQEIEQLVFT